jgi:amphi-Trp domain-containing protein
MQAKLGDRIVVRGHHVGDAERAGDIVDVRGADGAPPYVVRWGDGHEDLFFPSSDATIEAAEKGKAEVQTVSHGKRKEERTVSRAEAGRIFSALGASLAAGGPVEVSIDGVMMNLGSPGEVKLELEVDVDKKRTELELEAKWALPRGDDD